VVLQLYRRPSWTTHPVCAADQMDTPFFSSAEGLFVLCGLVEHEFSVPLDRMKKSIGQDLQDEQDFFFNLVHLVNHVSCTSETSASHQQTSRS